MGLFHSRCCVLGDIIHKSVPNGLEKYANKCISASRNYKIQMAVHPTKVANTAGSLQRSLDYAKFGQLYKTKVLGMGNKFYQRMDRQKFITPNNNIRGRVLRLSILE
jgi:hypothetical protein